MKDWWKSKRCLVTGAGGFIGHALVTRLLRYGARVHACGRTPPAFDDAEGLHGFDIRDLASVRDVLATTEPEVVFHCASKVSGSQAVDAVIPTFQDGLAGTVNLLEASVRAGRPRVICLGSLMEPDDSASSSHTPVSPYAAAKYAASAYSRMFASLYALPVTIAKLFMVYGPGQRDQSKLIPYLCTSLLRGQTAALSSGAQSFDWVYVDDVVDGLLAIAAREGLAGQSIDIGTGRLTSVRDVAVGIGRRLGGEQALDFGAVADRVSEPTRQADVQATRAAIDWTARLALDEGLDRTVAWFQETFESGI